MADNAGKQSRAEQTAYVIGANKEHDDDHHHDGDEKQTNEQTVKGITQER